MNTKSRTERTRRRWAAQNRTEQRPGLEKTVDTLAMHLCPNEEWRAYEQKTRYLVWKAQQKRRISSDSAKVCVFPIWRKYRHQAQKVANLLQVIPVLRHLPLPVTRFLGAVFF